MLFIETSIFTRLISNYLSDDEYAGLQGYLVEHPGVGAVIPGSRGVRKVRWRREGEGKRGGLRIIYYLKRSNSEIWMLTVYAKNERETIPAHTLRQIAEEIEYD